MDFNRTTQSPLAQHSAPAPVSNNGEHSSAQVPKQVRRSGKTKSSSTLLRTGAVFLLFALTVLVVSAIGIIFVGNDNDQSKYVMTGNYQAVVLTNGQVYFGNLKTVNKDYFRLDNVYYLSQDTTTDSKGTTTSDGNYTLMKLGCQQIHDPYDEMIIERTQISFWENLQNGQYSKVVKSISAYQTQNKGKTEAQLCATTSAQTQASDNSTTQGGSSNSITGTPSTTNSTTGSGTSTKTTTP